MLWVGTLLALGEKIEHVSKLADALQANRVPITSQADIHATQCFDCGEDASCKFRCPACARGAQGDCYLCQGSSLHWSSNPLLMNRDEQYVSLRDLGWSS